MTIVRKARIVWRAAIPTIFALFLAAPVAADPFYKNKTIRILTADAGNIYDAVARLVARHLPAHIEGDPIVIVQNMPGATVKIPLYLANVVAGDSTVIATLNNAVPFAPALGIAGADFDPMKFNYLGSPSTERGLVVVWHTVPVETIEDATRREIIMGVSGGPTASATLYGKLINAVFGTKFKLIPGYSGMAASLLAMERGETEGFPNVLWNALRVSNPDWITDKKVKFLLQYSRSPSDEPALAGVPLARDLARNDDDRQLIDSAVAPLDLGMPFVMAPGVDPENVRIVQAAFDATLRDPAFVADAEKMQFAVDPSPKTGKDISAIISEFYRAPQRVRDRLKRLMNGE